MSAVPTIRPAVRRPPRPPAERLPAVPSRGPGGPTLRAALLSVGVAAASLLVVAPAPSYDPWAWLLWGREISELRLSTEEGPAFKPLPVAIGAVLALTGADVAPVAWVLIARAGAVLALILSFRLATRLSGGSRAAGLLAAIGVALTGSFLGHAASGLSEPSLVALALAGVACARAGRPRAAFACAAACGLIRVETWPFLLVAAAVLWRRRPSWRPVVALAATMIPLAWFGPELLGSGDLLRSGARARIPEPGQPALAPVPALASLAQALVLVPWPLWAGTAALVAMAARRGRLRRTARDALAPAVAGSAWLALVALMAQAGFSGEPRYALPGAGLIAISGAVGVVLPLRAAAPRAVAAAPRVLGSAAVLVAATPVVVERVDYLASIREARAHHWRLATDLRSAIEAAGGRRAVLACGTPYVGPYRGTLAAYQLDVAKSVVEPDRRPQPPGFVFQSRLRAGSSPAPEVPATFVGIAQAGAWRVAARCRPSTPTRVRVP